ncbi:hypothetical protein TRAPUB_2414 [Trametes pubescens]|uniref:Uncharacterized protein n=1 Tax=Trametes pubescens TaxID=154538 RepID=A0A1M2VGN0_TRAPU|nr:hypothetical protein TRAPUB_2414 [Trametes pubescens]
MQYNNSFASSFARGTAKASSTTAETLFSVLATNLHQPRRAIDAPEWDPSRDEVVRPTASCSWGAVGGEQFAKRDSATRPQTFATPGRWGLANHQAPVKHGLPAPTEPWAAAWWAGLVPLKQYTPIDRKQLREEAYQLTESFNPFSSINIAVREAGETDLKQETKTANRAKRCPREEMEELTEEFNPFNPVNVAARAAAETTSPSTRPKTALIAGRQTPALRAQKTSAACESSPQSNASSESTNSSRGSTPPLQEHAHRATRWSMVHALEASLERRSAVVGVSPLGKLASEGAEDELEYRLAFDGAGIVEFPSLDDD